MATRWAGLEAAGPRGRGRGPRCLPPRTAARRPAWQARRRAWPAVILSPVVVWAIPAAVRSASSLSWSMSTTREVALPPWRGRSLLRMRSRRATNAMPCWRASGQVGELVLGRRGEGPERRLDGLLVLQVSAAGGGEGGQVGAQQAGGEVGDAGVQVGGPVAAACGGSPGWRRRRGVRGRGAAGSRLPRRSRGPGTPGSGTRRCSAPVGPRWSASVSIRVSALASRSSPRSLGSAARASVDDAGLGQVQGAGGERGGGLGPALVECLRRAWRRHGPGRGHRGWRWPTRTRWCGRRWPRRCRRRWPGRRSCSAWARAITRASPTSRSCFSPIVRNSGAIAASSSNPPSIRARGSV